MAESILERAKRLATPKPSANGTHTPDQAVAPAVQLKPWDVAPSAPPPAPGVTTDDLVHKVYPPARWAVEGLLSEGLTVLGGRPKQGKSWLSLLVAWAVAEGRELNGRKVHGGDVLYLALEDSERRLQSRLLKLREGLQWDASPRLTIATDWPKADVGGLYYIAQWLEKRPNARLVIVDTLARFRKAQKGNANGYGDDYEQVGAIQKLCLEYKVAGLVITHTRKLRAEDPFDELTGTMGISGAADSLMVLDRARGSEGGDLFVTGRDVGDATIPMTFRREHCLWELGQAAEGIERKAPPEPASKLEQCKAWLLEFLQVYAYPSAEIDQAGKANGFAPSAIRDAKAELGKNGTGQIVNRNFGGDRNNDWWSGIGDPAGWRRRPAPGSTRESETPKSQYRSPIPD